MELTQLVSAVDPRKTVRRARRRAIHVPVDLGVISIGVVLTVVAIVFPSLLQVNNPSLLILAVVALFAIGFYALRSDLRALHSINAIKVAERGFSPPFKPKQRLSRDDWFVPYKDIVSMVPVVEKGGFVPAYDVTLRDGLTFQLNALDLLLYVDEKEVRRYAKMLAVIRAEIEKPENRAKAERAEEITIPPEQFTTGAGGTAR